VQSRSPNLSIAIRRRSPQRVFNAQVVRRVVKHDSTPAADRRRATPKAVK